MNRWVIMMPVAGLAGLAAILGFRMGQPMTETEIINRYAAEYVETFGGEAMLTDCIATAGKGTVRLIVQCTHADGRRAVFPAGNRGELLPLTEGPEA